MSDQDDLPPLPEWARNLKPPPPVDETLRQQLIAMEIKRQQEAYYQDNPRERKAGDAENTKYA